MKKIGFIGLGTMGKPMAQNLLKQGYEVTVYNRTADRAAELIEIGAKQAFTPADAARGADVIITMLSNDQVLTEVFAGPNGIIHGVVQGQTMIDCSTVAPATSRSLYGQLSSLGVPLLDAPVTGSKPAAESATLTFMVGGDRDAFDAQSDLFAAMGKVVLYMGPSGSGATAKLAHNTMVGINLIGLAEGLSIATKAGLAPEQFLQVVASGSANSKQAELKGDKIVNRDFSNQFSLKLMLKDLLLASQLTGQYQLPTPLLHAATSIFQMGLSKGYGEEDLCSAVKCYEEWMGQEVQKTVH